MNQLVWLGFDNNILKNLFTKPDLNNKKIYYLE